MPTEQRVTMALSSLESVGHYQGNLVEVLPHLWAFISCLSPFQPHFLTSIPLALLSIILPCSSSKTSIPTKSSCKSSLSPGSLWYRFPVESVDFGLAPSCPLQKLFITSLNHAAILVKPSTCYDMLQDRIPIHDIENIFS